MSGRTVLEEPGACSERERRAFARLVRKGFAGSDETLPGRIRAAERLAFRYGADGTLLAIAGLKAPGHPYRQEVLQKAGADVGPDLHPLELGWVFVDPAHRGEGVGGRLCRRLLGSVPGSGVFATTRPDNAPMIAILVALGFRRVGGPFRHPRRDEGLALFLRPASGRPMTIWIDADAAPRDVKKIVFRAARRLQLRTLLVANQPLATPSNNPHVESVWVQSKALDAVDRHIVEHAAEGDVAVTADIPLAADLVDKGVVVLDPRGETYTEDNIGGRLAMRDFMDSLRGAGVDTGGPKPYGARDKRLFAAALDRVLGAARREDDP